MNVRVLPSTLHEAHPRPLRCQAQVHTHPGARPQACGCAPWTAAVRRAEACRATTALRFPARARRRAEIVGGSEGPVARSRGQTARGRGRGSPFRLRVVRGRHSREGVRRGQRHRLGLWRVFPGRGSEVLVRRPSRSRGASPYRARERQAEFFSARREAQGLVRAGAHVDEQAMAADQAQGPVRAAERRAGARAVGPFRPHTRRSPVGQTDVADGRRAPDRLRASRDDAEDHEPDARGDRRRASLRSQVVVRTQGRRLPRDRLRPGRGRAPAVASRHRPDTGLPGDYRRARDPGRRSDDPRRRDSRARCRGPPVVQCAAKPGHPQATERDRGGATPDERRVPVL